MHSILPVQYSKQLYKLKLLFAQQHNNDDGMRKIQKRILGKIRPATHHHWIFLSLVKIYLWLIYYQN